MFECLREGKKARRALWVYKLFTQLLSGKQEEEKEMEETGTAKETDRMDGQDTL
jgi:hypothetical protein